LASVLHSFTGGIKHLSGVQIQELCMKYICIYIYIYLFTIIERLKTIYIYIVFYRKKSNNKKLRNRFFVNV